MSDMVERVPVRTPDIVIRSEKEESLMFNPADGATVCVNSTGKFIWDMCDGNNRVIDVVGRIGDVFDVGREEAEKDCTEFIADMERSGFLGFRSGE
jgi:hypothetical protein